MDALQEIGSIARVEHYASLDALINEEVGAIGSLFIPMAGVDEGADMTTALTEVLDAIRAIVDSSNRSEDGAPSWSVSQVMLITNINCPSGNLPESIGCEAVRGFMRTVRLEMPAHVRVICMDTDEVDTTVDEKEDSHKHVAELSNSGNRTTE